jgi:peptide/nickel transport system substrate-binding protein
VTYVPIVDTTVRLANLKAGQLDLIERVAATDIGEIRGNSRLRLATVTEIGYQSININVGKGEPAKGPLGSDARVRQALELSIDRAAINGVVFNGEYVVGNQWISPENPYYQQKYPVPKRDVAKAKQLLAQAGVKTPVPVDFMVPQNPETRQVAEIIQAMAAEAGFDMKLRVVEFATSLKEAEEGRYQAYMLNWSGRPDPDGNLYIFHRTKAPQNYGGYSNPEVDAWLDEARTKSGPAERKAIYEKVTGKLLSEGSILYLFHRKWFIGHSAKLEGLKLLPDGLVRVVGLTLK